MGYPDTISLEMVRVSGRSYATKCDDELQKLAVDADQLAFEAQDVLRAEMTSRQLRNEAAKPTAPPVGYSAGFHSTKARSKTSGHNANPKMRISPADPPVDLRMRKRKDLHLC